MIEQGYSMYLCIHVFLLHTRAHICAFPVHARVLVCGPATQHSYGKKKRLGGRKLVLVDFSAKMLILTARNFGTCVLLLSAFKMRRSATRPPISMWSALPWPAEFPLCPLAIVSPPGPDLGLGTSIPQPAPCSFQTPTPVSPSPLHSTLSDFFPPNTNTDFPSFPSVSALLLWSQGRDLCFLGSPVIAISCYRESSPPKESDVNRHFWLAAGRTREVVVVIVTGE